MSNIINYNKELHGDERIIVVIDDHYKLHTDPNPMVYGHGLHAIWKIFEAQPEFSNCAFIELINDLSDVQNTLLNWINSVDPASNKQVYILLDMYIDRHDLEYDSTAGSRLFEMLESALNTRTNVKFASLSAGGAGLDLNVPESGINKAIIKTHYERHGCPTPDLRVFLDIIGNDFWFMHPPYYDQSPTIKWFDCDDPEPYGSHHPELPTNGINPGYVRHKTSVQRRFGNGTIEWDDLSLKAFVHSADNSIVAQPSRLFNSVLLSTYFDKIDISVAHGYIRFPVYPAFPFLESVKVFLDRVKAEGNESQYKFLRVPNKLVIGVNQSNPKKLQERWDAIVGGIMDFGNVTRALRNALHARVYEFPQAEYRRLYLYPVLLGCPNPCAELYITSDFIGIAWKI